MRFLQETAHLANYLADAHAADARIHATKHKHTLDPESDWKKLEQDEAEIQKGTDELLAAIKSAHPRSSSAPQKASSKKVAKLPLQQVMKELSRSVSGNLDETLESLRKMQTAGSVIDPASKASLRQYLQLI